LRKLPAVSVTFTNKVTTLNVAFAVFGKGTQFTIKPNATTTINVAQHVGRTPYVRIYQVGGGYLDFTLANNGKYKF
jgi:hypothetical protein